MISQWPPSGLKATHTITAKARKYHLSLWPGKYVHPPPLYKKITHMCGWYLIVRDPYQRPETQISNCDVASAAWVNWGKSAALTFDKWCGGLSALPQNVKWKRGGKVPGSVFVSQGHLLKRTGEWWHGYPHMSFSGRVLVLNNLVTSQLWHRWPPSGLASRPFMRAEKELRTERGRRTERYL